MTTGNDEISGTVMGIHYRAARYGRPFPNAPQWLKELYPTRGVADALDPFQLLVTPANLAAAIAVQGVGDGSACVLYQAGTRSGVMNLYIFRGTAWLDFGTGPALRFTVPVRASVNVVRPFDDGRYDDVIPGVYALEPPSVGNTLSRRDAINKQREPKQARPKKTGIRKGGSDMSRCIASALA